MKRRDEFFSRAELTNQRHTPRQTASEAPLLSSNALCTYLPTSLSLLLLYTQPSTQRQKNTWCTESVSEHIEKDVHVSTNPYLSVCKLLLYSTLHTVRKAQPSEQTYRGLAHRKSVASRVGTISALDQTTRRTISRKEKRRCKDEIESSTTLCMRHIYMSKGHRATPYTLRISDQSNRYQHVLYLTNYLA